MLRAQIDAEREQYQPTPLEKVMAMMKSLFMRGMVIYFVVSVFKLSAARKILSNGSIHFMTIEISRDFFFFLLFTGECI